jgi:hypothetical protein
MASGQSAFGRESTAETIHAVTSIDPKPLTEFVKGIPDDLEQIVRRSLRKSRDQRYASALDVAHDLERCRAFSDPESGINLRVLLRNCRRPRVAIPAVVGLVLVLAFAAWAVARSSKVRWARRQALQEIGTAGRTGENGRSVCAGGGCREVYPGRPGAGKALASGLLVGDGADDAAGCIRVQTQLRFERRLGARGSFPGR